MNFVLQRDIEDFVSSFSLKSDLKNAKILITGGTGLIGSTLVHCLLALENNIEVVLPVRNKEKADLIFSEERSNLKIISCNLVEFLQNLQEKFTYIIHCASPTNGMYMVNHPIETFNLAVNSTNALLSYAVRTKVKSIVYVSSLEYYGQVNDDVPITERDLGYIDHSDPRSCYPLGKRSAEFLCSAYAHQYGINVMSARLTQTFGAGVSLNDNRVFAQFARSIINGTDITLHTKGESAKPYCYTIDTVSAILYIMLRGKSGEAYNVANSDSYISIVDMAYYVRQLFNTSIQIKFELSDSMGYASVTKLNLSSSKLMSLGWKPKYNLKQMYDRLIAFMRAEQ